MPATTLNGGSKSVSHRGAKRGKGTTRFTTLEKLVIIGAALALVILAR